MTAGTDNRGRAKRGTKRWFGGKYKKRFWILLSEIGEVLGLVLLLNVSVSLLVCFGDADSDKWQVPTIGSTKCFTKRGKYSNFRER